MNKRGFIQIGALIALIEAVIGAIVGLLVAIASLLGLTSVEGIAITGVTFLIPESNELCYENQFCVQPYLDGDYITGDFLVKGVVNSSVFDYSVDFGYSQPLRCKIPEGNFPDYTRVTCLMPKAKLESVNIFISKAGTTLPAAVLSGSNMKKITKVGKCLASKGKKCF